MNRNPALEMHLGRFRQQSIRPARTINLRHQCDHADRLPRPVQLRESRDSVFRYWRPVRLHARRQPLKMAARPSSCCRPLARTTPSPSQSCPPCRQEPMSRPAERHQLRGDRVHGVAQLRGKTAKQRMTLIGIARPDFHAVELREQPRKLKLLWLRLKL